MAQVISQKSPTSTRIKISDTICQELGVHRFDVVIIIKNQIHTDGLILDVGLYLKPFISIPFPLLTSFVALNDLLIQEINIQKLLKTVPTPP